MAFLLFILVVGRLSERAHGHALRRAGPRSAHAGRGRQKHGAGAADSAAAAAWALKVEDRIYSNLPADTVVRQSPPPNERVKTGQNAHVVLSLGPQRVDHSATSGSQPARRSGRACCAAECSSAKSQASICPDGCRTPSPSRIPRPVRPDVTGPHVNLLVSLGARPAAYVMPELVGLPLPKPSRNSDSAGMRLSKLTAESGVERRRPAPSSARRPRAASASTSNSDHRIAASPSSRSLLAKPAPIIALC